MWRVAANILNNQPRTCNKGWYSSLGFGWRIIIAWHKKWFGSVTYVTRVVEPGCFHLKARDHLAYLDLSRRIILKTDLKAIKLGCIVDMFGLRQRISRAYVNIGMLMRMTWCVCVGHIMPVNPQRQTWDFN
jgi:hypothetical protein